MYTETGGHKRNQAKPRRPAWKSKHKMSPTTNTLSDRLASILIPLLPPNSLVLPSDPGYDRLRRPFNTRFATAPLAIALPQTTANIAACVKTAVQLDVKIAVRAGGHSYEGYCVANDAFVIDLRDISSVAFLPDELVDVEAGCWIGKLDVLCDEKGLAIPGGTCPSVGIAGLALGGGFGPLSRALGLTCDAIVGMEVVMADGSVVWTSKAENSELFGALRGAGACSFGIVARFRMRAARIPGLLSKAEWKFRFEDAKVLIARFVEKAPGWPRSIGAVLQGDAEGGLKVELYHMGSASTFPTDVIKPDLIGDGDSEPEVDGPHESTRVAKLLAGNGDTSFYLDRDLVEEKAGFGKFNFKAASHFLSFPKFDLEGIDALLARLAKAPPELCSPNLWFQIDPWGGRVSDVDESATSFVHRGPKLCSIQLYVGWNSENEALDRQREKLAESFIRQWAADIEHWCTGQRYQNYIERGVELERYYGAATLERLEAMKKRIDPSGVFGFEQGIGVA